MNVLNCYVVQSSKIIFFKNVFDQNKWEKCFFENNEKESYSIFLDGPHVTVNDDGASTNAIIRDNSPEDPFVWDGNSAG